MVGVYEFLFNGGELCPSILSCERQTPINLTIVSLITSKAEAPNYDLTRYKDNYLYILQFFNESTHCNYFIYLPMEDIQTRRIFLRNNEDYFIGFYEEEVNYLAGEEKTVQIRFIIAEIESVVVMLDEEKVILDYKEPVLQTSFSTKDEVLKILKSSHIFFLKMVYSDFLQI